MEIAGHRCVVFSEHGPSVTDVRAARDMVEEALSERAGVIVVPVGRLDPAFFQLRSGIAGEFLQKMANYSLKFAAVGDISSYVGASEALRDFVVESNRGRSIFFVPDSAALEARLLAASRTDPRSARDG
jgi:hypothetical protein